MMVEPSSVEDFVYVPTFMIENDGVPFFPKTPKKEHEICILFIFNVFKSSNKDVVGTLACNQLFVSGRSHTNLVVGQLRNKCSKLSG